MKIIANFADTVIITDVCVKIQKKSAVRRCYLLQTPSTSPNSQQIDFCTFDIINLVTVEDAHAQLYENVVHLWTYSRGEFPV